MDEAAIGVAGCWLPQRKLLKSAHAESVPFDKMGTTRVTQYPAMIVV